AFGHPLPSLRDGRGGSLRGQTDCVNFPRTVLPPCGEGAPPPYRFRRCVCWKQATSCCETLLGFFEFHGCVPTWRVPALPVGLKAHPRASLALPGGEGGRLAAAVRLAGCAARMGVGGKSECRKQDGSGSRTD